MGASGWSYFTDYKPDPKEALKELHAEILAPGDFYWPGKKPTTMQALKEGMNEDGTHSAIDIYKCSDEPAKSGGDFGTAHPIEQSQLEAWFGTAQLDRDQATEAASRAMTACGRWSARYIVVYENDHPVSYLFTGVTGD